MYLSEVLKMGAASSDAKCSSSVSPNLWVPPWKGLLNHNFAASGLDRLLATGRTIKEKIRTTQPPSSQGEKTMEWSLPHCISLFLPEFPVWTPSAQQELKIIGCVAKGSIGPVLKVLDCSQQKVFALKVLPKGEILRSNTLKQCKEEVSIQRQVKHPFVQCLGESWQGQRHLYIMCSYCSYGDLYSLWSSSKRIDEDTVRLFAAELVSALVYLHDVGIIHRDVKMENVLLDERAPEVLSGGPYSHAADWWSLGVLLFALVTGEFPVAPEKDHVTMLDRVTQATYSVPICLSQGLSNLLKELLCRVPRQRLRYLHQFKSHPFFRGITFDPVLLQKFPVELVLTMRKSEITDLSQINIFEDFDCELTGNLNSPYPA
ncbi:ribosomal protein S6 kinase-related protein isoform 3-T3 [Rhinophrynus dorsalis]